MHRQGNRDAGKRIVAVIAVLLVAFGLVARMVSPAEALPDTAPPELHGGTLAEPSIVADAPADSDRTLHFTASLSDNTTGMQYAFAQFVSPSSKQYFSVAFAVPFGGAIITPVDVAGTGTLQRYAETGTWTLQSFSMMDVATNQINLNNAAVATTGFPTSFAVTGTDDLVAPDVIPASSSILPGTPLPGDDADPATRTFTIQTHLTDNLAGVAWISAGFTLNGHWVYPSFNRISGDELDGTWVGTATVPRYSAVGTWQLQNLQVGDRVQNQLDLDATGAAAIGFPTTFEVTGTDDLTPPALVAFDFDPKKFNNVGCKTTVNITAHLTDGVSGTSYFGLSFNGPAGQYHSASLSLASGTEADGIWTGSFSLPFESATGTWTLGNAYLGDHANNQANFSAGDLTTAGFPTAFAVVAGTGEVCVSPDLTLQEGGSANTTVNMTTQPAADVDVALTQAPGVGAASATQLSLSPTTVHFTPENWNVPQSVTVQALDDAITEANPHQAIIKGAATSADPVFDGQAPTATVTISEKSPSLVAAASPGSVHGTDGYSTSWTFTLTNTGAGGASNPQFVVSVPAVPPGFTITSPGSMNDGFTCAEAVLGGSTDYTCTRAAPLIPGEIAAFTITTDAHGDPGDAPVITATGTADATAATPASTATATAMIDTPIFNLHVSTTTDVGQQALGGPVNWTATVENTSTDLQDATGIVFTFDVPTGLDLSGPPVMSGYACTPSSGSGPITVTCSGGPPLPVTKTATLTVPTSVTAADGEKLTSIASAKADQTDADPSDDSAAAAVTVADVADISTTKTVSSSSVADGQTVTWTITATNTSTTTAAVSPTISDTLPGGLTPVNVVAPTGFTCTTTSSDLQCSASTLAAGATAELRFDTVVKAKFGSKFVNTATATAKNDPDPKNDEASAGVKISANTGRISGTVTEVGSGDPLGGIDVRVFDPVTLREVAGSQTQPDGTYQIDNVDVGGYLVRFTDQSGTHAQQWYDHVDPLSAASTVVIASAGDEAGKIDAALDSGFTISGTVTSESDASPLGGICVAAFDPSAPNFNNSAAAETQTASDGTYALTGLAPTPYLILFRDCSKTPVYALEFHDGGTGTADATQATEVNPKGLGQDIDAALGTGGSLSGSVFQLPGNVGIEGRCVVVFSPGFGALAVTITDANGAYHLGGVPTGQWYVAAGDCKGGDDAEFVWYDGPTSIPVTRADDGADPVRDGAKLVAVVAGAETTGINLYFGAASGGETPTDTPTGATPTDPAAAANAGTSSPLSGSLPRTGVPGPDMAILGGVLLGVGLFVVKMSEVRRAR